MHTIKVIKTQLKHQKLINRKTKTQFTKNACKSQNGAKRSEEEKHNGIVTTSNLEREVVIWVFSGVSMASEEAALHTNLITDTESNQSSVEYQNRLCLNASMQR